MKRHVSPAASARKAKSARVVAFQAKAACTRSAWPRRCGGEVQDGEQPLDRQARQDHGGVERNPQQGRRPESVVAAVDVQDGQHDQVAEDEGRHAPKARASLPEHRGQRHVAYRADEGEHRHHRPDEGARQHRRQRMAGQEQSGPDTGWDPGRHRAGDQQAHGQVHPQRHDVHDEEVRHRRQSLGREQALQQRSVLAHRHVHGGVALHAAGHAALGLRPGGLARAAADQQAQEQPPGSGSSPGRRPSSPP